MPCTKKSISPLYFQIYTHLFTDNLFLLCMCVCVQMLEDVCDCFPNSTDGENLLQMTETFTMNRSGRIHYTARAGHYPVK